MADLLHLDDITGALARVAQLLRPRARDTLDRLGCYEGLPVESLFPAPEQIPRVARRRRWRLPGLVSEDLVFPSFHEPLEPAFRRHYHRRRRRIHTVYARRITPDSGGARPRLLYIHGYMQPETVIEEFAVLALFAHTLDVEVVQLQPPYHGRRKPRRSRFDGELFWTADVVSSMESLRQTVLDARTLLGWLEQESADAPVLGAMRADLRRFGWSPRDFAAFTERVGWSGLRPVIPKERIHLFAMQDDRFFRPEVVTRMWREWGEPAIHWYPGSHMGFVAVLPDAVRRLRRFVDALALETREAERPAPTAG